jgi:hypothetical protein
VEKIPGNTASKEHYKGRSQNCHMNLFGIMPLMMPHDAAVNLIMFLKSCFWPFSKTSLQDVFMVLAQSLIRKA